MKMPATSYADNHSTVHLATTLWTTIIKNGLLNLHVLSDLRPWRQSHSCNVYNNCTTIIIAHLLKANKLWTNPILGASSYTKYLIYRAFKFHKLLTGSSRKNASELCGRPTATGTNSRDFRVKSNFTANTKSIPRRGINGSKVPSN